MSVILIVILCSTLFLCLFYFFVALRLDFSLSTILCEFEKADSANKQLCLLVKLSVNKVNGWNKMTMFYTILHYVLNIWSIAFSCISIYYSYNNVNVLSLLFSIGAVLSLTCNLFLRCERKWATFREVLAKGRIATNNFISSFSSVSNLEEFTREYANEIIRLESSLNNSDIT